MTSSPAPLELLAAAEAWLAADPDPQTAAELRELIDRAAGDGQPAAAAQADLADRFAGTLAFGTAGLRAALGAGPGRMNRVVVRRTAAGLAKFLLDTAGGSYVPRVVVGYDARHNSAAFATESAAVFTALGLQAFLLPAALPTPVLAYAVKALDCDAGVMVTASHNPPQDNGYKVYLGGRVVPGEGRGAQIVPPYDAAIAARIDYAAALETIPLAPSGWELLPASGEPGSIEDAYVEAVAGVARPDLFPHRKLKIVLTPLHGVGGRTLAAVLRQAGFTDLHPVQAQADPDPDFPTVAFPNPEEAGALDLALAAAEELQADIVLANDPDADRLAVALKVPETGRWAMLRGDETGALLGAHMVARLRAAGTPGGAPTEDTGPAEDAATAVFANSIVSSRLLGKIAAAAGLKHVQTLTGFKWIARVPQLAYGYEEALGYCVAPDLVTDKDGISAALLAAEMAADALAAGRELRTDLDELQLAHGVHATDQLSVRVGSLDLLDAMMKRLRDSPPESFGGSAVTSIVDLTEGSAGLPPTEGLQYLTRDDSRVIIRPSGTEPKLKCYIEVIRPVPAADLLEQVHAEIGGTIELIREDISDALGL
ncbi:phospho-sugar mutase [Arthrobacter sp. I2-34]|uniref:Phospho-sugar mutase n=1 Tax=Arthrobacter hankyongi TaxID=2904801 RepID=A0ABS9L1G7_9MICC|nr:phospho-sugar mutase [Arthrobacter hankyongi]MCG2620491.1 phospho-sugar mutase [Arthrobacter hankyongi]